MPPVRRRAGPAAVSLVLALAVAACHGTDGSSPDCVAALQREVAGEVTVQQPETTPPVFLGVLQLRQAIFTYDDPACPEDFVNTYVRFDPNVATDGRLLYTLRFFAGGDARWTYQGEVRLDGRLEPTEELLVTEEPTPLDEGNLQLTVNSYEER